MAESTYVAAQAAVLIVPTLGKGSQAFHTKLEAELKRQKHEVEVRVKAQTDKALAEIAAAKKAAEADPITLHIDYNDRNSLTEIRHKYDDLRTEMKKGITFNVGVAGITQLSQAGSAIAALNKDVVALSQSLLLLPGMVSTLAAGLGGLLTGVHGVSGAFKELNDAQKDSADNAAKVAAAQRAVQDAARGMSNAVKDARRNLQDLNDQMRDAPLDEAEALLNLRDAQQEAANGFGKTAVQRQRDMLRLAKAESALSQTRKRNARLSQDVAEANAKGVAGSDQVVAASERLAHAQGAAEAATSKMSKALGELSPNAQSFVQATMRLKDAWSGLQSSAQDSLFAGLDTDIEKLASSALPKLSAGLTQVNQGLNTTLRATMASLGSDRNASLMSKIFGNTGDTGNRLATAVDPLLHSFLQLSEVGSQFMPRLVSGFGVLGQRFDKFVGEAAADGSLEKWTNSGIDALKQLGDSLLNIGSIMNSVADAFSGSGGKGFLQLVEKSTKRLAELLKSTSGQNALVKYFSDARDELAKWRSTLTGIPQMIGNLKAAMKSWADMMLPFLQTASGLLAQHPGLVQAIFYAYMGWKTLSPVIKTFTTGLEGVQTVIKRIGDETAGANGTTAKVGKLAAAFGPQLLLGAATVLVTFMTGRFVSGMHEGETALERQRAKAEALKQTLDDVTGAATKASQALVVKQWQDASNSGTGKKIGNLVPTLQARGVDTSALSAAVARGDSGQIEQLLASKGLSGATAATVEATEWWKIRGKDARDHGMTSQMVADAINGVPDAVKKFEDYSDDEFRRRNSLAGWTNASHDAIRGYRNLGFGVGNAGPAGVSDLANIKGQLDERTQNDSNVRGVINEQLTQLGAGSSSIAQASQAQFGQVSLNQAGKGLFGPDAQVQYSADGMTIVTTRPLTESLKNDIIANGGSVVDSGPGAPVRGALVQLKPDRANRYVSDQVWGRGGVPGFANGGKLSGAGTGRSDSMLARVSNGEFISRASSVAKYGSDFYDSLNRGEIDPKSLPGFAGGGFLSQFSRKPGERLSPLGNKIMGGFSAIGRGIKRGWDAAWEPHVPHVAVKQVPSVSSMRKDHPSNPGSGALPGRSGLPDASGDLFGRGVSDVEPTTGGEEPLGHDPNWFTRNGIDPATRFGFSGAMHDVANSLPGSVDVPEPQHLSPGKPVTPGVRNVERHSGSGARPGPMSRPVVPSRPSVPLQPPARPSVPMVPLGGVPGLLPGVGGGVPLPPIVGGSEQGMQLNTVRAARSLQQAFPQITTIGGWRPEDGYNEHSSGQAADLMLPNYSSPEGQQLGQSVVGYALQNASDLGIDYVIFDQSLWYPDGRVVPMENLGSDTKNHMDHVHVHTTGGGLAGDGGFDPSQLIGPGGLSALPGVLQGDFPMGAPSMLGGGIPGMPGLDPSIMGGGFDLNSFIAGMPPQINPINIAAQAGQIFLSSLLGFFGINPGILAPLQQLLSGSSNGYAISYSGNYGFAGQMRNFRMGTNPGSIFAPGGALGMFGGQGGMMPGGGMDMSMLFGGLGAIGGTGGTGGDPSLNGMLNQYLTQQGAVGPDGSFAIGMGGAEQYRQLVAQIVASVASRYGITNQQAWVDDIIGQIQHESGGDPNAYNAVDSDGLPAIGLGQFKQGTFDAHNVSGGSIGDPVAQIYAMIDYLASSKYGVIPGGGVNWKGVGYRNGQGYANGGHLSGPGTGRSDSMLARVSTGEFISRAASVSKYGPGFYHALNKGEIDPKSLPGFAGGGEPLPKPVVKSNQGAAGNTGAAGSTPTSALPPAGSTAMKPPAETTEATPAVGAGDGESDPMSDLAGRLTESMGGLGGNLGGGADTIPGAEGPEGSDDKTDPRSKLGAAPTNLNHNNAALSQGLKEGLAHVGALAGTALSMAASGAGGAGGMGAGAGVAAAGAGASMAAQAAGQVAGQVADGAMNILSSLMVGTLTSGTTDSAYGAPMLPQQQKSAQGDRNQPQIVNNYGDIHTANYDEFYRGQQRREAQQTSPMMPQR